MNLSIASGPDAFEAFTTNKDRAKLGANKESVDTDGHELAFHVQLNGQSMELDSSIDCDTPNSKKMSF